MAQIDTHEMEIEFADENGGSLIATATFEIENDGNAYFSYLTIGGYTPPYIAAHAMAGGFETLERWECQAAEEWNAAQVGAVYDRNRNRVWEWEA